MSQNYMRIKFRLSILQQTLYTFRLVALKLHDKAAQTRAPASVLNRLNNFNIWMESLMAKLMDIINAFNKLTEINPEHFNQNPVYDGFFTDSTFDKLLPVLQAIAQLI